MRRTHFICDGLRELKLMLCCAGVQGQCGGNALSCGKGYTTPCISAPWPTAVCRSSGWTCNRYGELPLRASVPPAEQHTCCQSVSAAQFTGFAAHCLQALRLDLQWPQQTDWCCISLSFMSAAHTDWQAQAIEASWRPSEAWPALSQGPWCWTHCIKGMRCLV